MADMFSNPAAIFTTLGMLTQAFGARQASRAAMDNASREAQASVFVANQYTQQAGQEIAVAQRQAIEVRRQSQLLQSRALAVAAASGAGASDPTIIQLISQVSGEGAYRAAVALYDGEEKARQLRMKADASRYEAASAVASGEAQSSAYKLSAASSLLQGAGTLYTRYGMGGPATQDAAPIEERKWGG